MSFLNLSVLQLMADQEQILEETACWGGSKWSTKSNGSPLHNPQAGFVWDMSFVFKPEMWFVNLIWSRGLNYCQFTTFLDEIDLLPPAYSNTKCLNSGNVLYKFFFITQWNESISLKKATCWLLSNKMCLWKLVFIFLYCYILQYRWK